MFSSLCTHYVDVSATSYPRFSVIFFLIFTLYVPIFNSLRLLGEFARVFVTIALVCIYIDISILYILYIISLYRMYKDMSYQSYFLNIFFFSFLLQLSSLFLFFLRFVSLPPDLVIKQENEIAIVSETFVAGDAHGHSRVLRSRILWHGSIYQRLFRPRRA